MTAPTLMTSLGVGSIFESVTSLIVAVNAAHVAFCSSCSSAETAASVIVTSEISLVTTPVPENILITFSL